MPKRVMLVLFLLINRPVFSLDDASYANGWYWGNDESKNDSVHEVKKEVNNERKVVSNSMILDEINNNVKEAKAKAILQPTTENTANYIRLQNKVVGMATDFSTSWKKAMLKYPELDYTTSNPTNNNVVSLMRGIKKENIKHAVKEFSTTYGIVFFFRGRDNISLFQSEILKDFADGNSITIIPVSLDETGNKYFPSSKSDNGKSEKLGIKTAPAMIALNARTNKAYPLAFGIKTKLELEEAIFALLQGDIDEYK